MFYNTKPPKAFDEIAQGGGWLSNGHGELLEKITIARNGQAYTSEVTFQLFDEKGKAKSGKLHAMATGERVRF